MTWRRAALVLAVSSAGACSTVLGFEDVSLDPQWNDDAAGPGGSAGSTGSAEGGGGAGNAPATSSSAGGSGGEGEAISCESYCKNVMKTCTLSNRQYESEETCLGVCKYLPEGDAADVRGNSLACRYNAAKTAEIAEPSFNCPAAGPGGNDVCGSNCEGYCGLFMEVCAEGEWFADYPACLADCELLEDKVGFNVTPANQTGLTVDCRLFHVSAATLQPDFHCPHAAGENPCIVGGEY